jgi:DNA-directed RNA polymerase specialized sigma24 family protein
MSASGVNPGGGFATTRWSQVVQAGGGGGEGRAALEWLCRAYWEPLRRHAARRGWREPEDAVQDFWLRLIERGSLVAADPAKGRFRAWLLACLNHHLADRAAAAAALKRGGGSASVPIGEGEGCVPVAVSDPDPDFDRAWAEAMLARARARLVREHAEPEQARRFQRLERFLDGNGDGAAYARAAAELGVGESAIKVAVHRLREHFRACLRAEVAETLAEPSAAAVDAELADLLASLGG